MSKILLVEDDENLGFLVQDSLENKGYTVEWCANGAVGLKAFQLEPFDLCILDVMLPQVDGFALAQEIRKQNTDIPIVFLTAKSRLEDRLHGFTVGADDYVTKPFSMEELHLRLQAILKRAVNQSLTNGQNQAKIQFGNSVLDYLNLQLTVHNQKQTLTQKEADILRMLSLNLNTLVKRDVILKSVWEDNGYFVARSMDVFISKLRKYLKEDTSLRIVNIHGVGYKLETNLEVIS